MEELYLRTEDIDDKEILDLCVETKQDREIIDLLKARSPIILVGSRGVGKTFLMKVATAELKRSFAEDRILPVYLSFIKSSLVAVNNKDAFQSWMLSVICSNIVKQLKRFGIIVESHPSIDILSGGTFSERAELKIDSIRKKYEDSWKKKQDIDDDDVPTVDDLKMAVEEICEENGLSRIVLFIDEAAHNFIREQQAQFFTLFRDLRCAKISCKAAVYPGVTAYGSNFQYSQDATFKSLNRSIMEPDYISFMKGMVEKQITDSGYLKELSKKGQSFSDLVYAASGNPRFLLNNIRAINKFNSTEIEQCIKEFYRVTIFADHTALSSMYPNLKELIDWGRSFLENTVLPEMQKRNTEALAESGKNTTVYFWIHKDSPEAVKRAISLLEYSGLVQEITKGLKATRGEVGTRYMVNIGCLFALEANPLKVSHEIINRLSASTPIEYGKNSIVFNGIKDNLNAINDNDISVALSTQLQKTIDGLELSYKMKEKLHGLNLHKIIDVMNAPEEKLKEAYYVGDVRARMMKRVAMNSIYEYLIG